MRKEEEEDGKQGKREKQEQKVKTCQDVWVRGTKAEQNPDAKTETTEVWLIRQEQSWPAAPPLPAG